MNIREIENIIDHVHDKHPFFKLKKNQAIYNILSAFQDGCTTSLMASILNPIRLKSIVDYMDSLNVCLKWIDEKMIPYYPLGCYKDRSAESEVK